MTPLFSPSWTRFATPSSAESCFYDSGGDNPLPDSLLGFSTNLDVGKEAIWCLAAPSTQTL
jgi:hypothetical protein